MPLESPMTPSQKSRLCLEVEAALHDLCQPLTALQFGLEIGRQSGDIEVLRQTVEQGLNEAARMRDAIAAMRKILAHTKAPEWMDSSLTDTRHEIEDLAK
jgi:hypothetical protein